MVDEDYFPLKKELRPLQKFQNSRNRTKKLNPTVLRRSARIAKKMKPMVLRRSSRIASNCLKPTVLRRSSRIASNYLLEN